MQSAGTVFGFGDLPAKPFEMAPRDTAALFFVVDDEDDAVAIDVSPERCRQSCAVDRLGQELGSTERDGKAAIGKHGHNDDRRRGKIRDRI